MKYEEVTIDGKKLFKVPFSGPDNPCNGCHFDSDSWMCKISASCGETGHMDTWFIFQTEEELAAQSILKKQEKQRNID